jgi:large subunit ribosomal protein L30
MKQIEITLVKSTIDRPETQKKTVKALGLNKLNSKVVQNETPQILGMIRKVSHLVKIEYK